MFSASDDWENGMLGEEENSVEDDIKGTSEHFLAQRTAKTAEEISKYCVAEGLDEISRTMSILKVGMPIQRTSILSKFKLQSSGKYRDAFRDKVVPICLEILNSESPQYQIECGSSLLEILPQMNAVKALSILQSAKNFINHKNEDLQKPWREVFLAAVSKMSEDDVKKEVLLEAMADSGSTAQTKIWSGRKLASLAGKLDAKKFESHLYPRISILCQDTDGEVRKAMCPEMGLIIKSWGLKLSKKTVFPEFMDLINDEDIAVQEAALASLMDLSEMFDAETRINTLIPTWKKICTNNDERLLLSASIFIGQFLWKCRGELADSDRQLFVTYYQALSSSTDGNVRRNCVFNYPAIVTVFKPQNLISFKLDAMLLKFEKDEDNLVRRTFACFFNDLCSLLGQNAFRHLGETLKVFLQGQDESVQKEIYKNLSSVLTTFQTAGNPKYQSYLDGLLTVILDSRKSFDEKPNGSWRMHESILKSMDCFPIFFDNDVLNENLVGSLQKILLEAYPGPVKKQAAKILVTFMRKLKRHEHHETILRVLLDIKDERSYQVRILYFDICEEVLVQFSQRFFRAYFFIPYLGLSRDLIPNIRMRFVDILPLTRHTIRVPTDQLLLAKLVDVCETLAQRDTDQGVVMSMKQFNKKYGIISAPECCQFSEESSLDTVKDKAVVDLQKSDSNASITDAYLKAHKSWETLSSIEDDKQKEEAEQKTQFFLLDPSKRPVGLKATAIKKVSVPPVASLPMKKPSLIVKKDVVVPNRRESLPMPPAAVSKTITNKLPGTPPLATGDAIGKAATIPRVTKPIAKKGIKTMTLETPEPMLASTSIINSTASNSPKLAVASKAAIKPIATPLGAKKLK